MDRFWMSPIVPVAMFAALVGSVHGCAVSVSPGFLDAGGSGASAGSGDDASTTSSGGSGGNSGFGSSGGSSGSGSGFVSSGGSGGGSSGSGSGSSGSGGGSSGSGSGSSGSGSSSGSGASSGSSGGGAAVDSGPCSNPLIDNMENGMGAIFPACSRVGFWYTYNDKTPGAAQIPAAGAMFTDSTITPARGTSMMAARTTGMGFTVYGAGMGFDLNNPGGTTAKSTYNASMYSGVSFWVMGSAGGTVRFNVSDTASDPSGGICMGTSGTSQCNDHHGHTLTPSTSWQQVSFTWSQLTQQGFGYVEANLDTGHLVGMQFQIASPTGAFDLWIDDLAFTP